MPLDGDTRPVPPLPAWTGGYMQGGQRLYATWSADLATVLAYGHWVLAGIAGGVWVTTRIQEEEG